jgi:hypothetical protein
MDAAVNFSPLGKVTTTEIALFVGILLILNDMDAFFLIDVEVVPAVTVIFFVAEVAETALTAPLFSIVITGWPAGFGDGVGVTADPDAVGDGAFFTKAVKMGLFKSNNPVSQYLQRSFASAGTSMATHG